MSGEAPLEYIGLSRFSQCGDVHLFASRCHLTETPILNPMFVLEHTRYLSGLKYNESEE